MKQDQNPPNVSKPSLSKARKPSPVVAEKDEARHQGEARGKGTVVVCDEAYKDHHTGVGHPEQPARMDAVVGTLRRSGLYDRLEPLAPRPCTDAEILSCHVQSYLQVLLDDIAGGASQLRTGDTAVCDHSLDIARRAAGGLLVAIDKVLCGEAKNAFCAVRPPGHHATPNRGMGFCLLNNVAIAARYAQQKHGAEKVLIVDWDVHHGNGTQDIFYEDESVFFFSTHQSPWYPGTGAADETGKGKGRGTTLNQPLPAGSGRREIVGAFTDRLLPAAHQFHPDLVLISAGFDSRIGDPLGQFTLSDDDFAELTTMLLDFANSQAGGRVVSVLEGGYNLAGLGKATEAHVRVLVEHSSSKQ